MLYKILNVVMSFTEFKLKKSKEVFMKINKLVVKGFKSLVDLEINFDEKLTVVVGENDAGKTSIIECMKVITQGRSVGADDFTHNYNSMEISVEIENFTFSKRYQKSGVEVEEEPMKAIPTIAYVQSTLERIRSESFDLSIEDNHKFIRDTARLFGFMVKSNSIVENLRQQLISRLSAECIDPIEGAIFPKFNNIQLDGRHFESVPAFFKEVFLKEKQASIWNEEVAEGTTIEGFIRSHLEDYSIEVSNQIRERGIIDKLKVFLPDLTDIRIDPLFHARDLNVDAKVQFLENGNEISIENKGDGTKRRMTMALLELKKEQSKVTGDDQAIYLLDEPDTHLHVRAQLDLVKTVEGFSAVGNQIILTTHSPFIVNAVKPNQIRLLTRYSGKTSLKSLSDNPYNSDKILRALGIENTHIFFSRTIIIVEGETEEAFIPLQYLRQTGRTISSGLIKVINVNGVSNIIGFARAILELHDPEKILILCDNDASSELQQLIDVINIPTPHKFQVGVREFEDAFESAVLQRVWAEYHQESQRDLPGTWTTIGIQELKNRCLIENLKFSKEIRALNQSGKKMTKPIFGAALGSRAEIGDLPQRLQELFNLIIS